MVLMRICASCQRNHSARPLIILPAQKTIMSLCGKLRLRKGGSLMNMVSFEARTHADRTQTVAETVCVVQRRYWLPEKPRKNYIRSLDLVISSRKCVKIQEKLKRPFDMLRVNSLYMQGPTLVAHGSGPC